MPHFQYKARSGRGDPVQGHIEAASADAVAEQLFNSGITPVEIVETRPRSDPLGALKARLAERKPRLDDLIVFARQMYTLMRAGIPITRAMNGLVETNRNPLMARVLTAVVEDLESGRDLAGALGRHPKIFDSLFVSIVHMGENTGRLDEAFLQIAEYLELEKDTRDRIKAAVRYPSFVVVAIVIAIVVINLLVIPAFARIFDNFALDLPWATRVLIATSNFMVAYWPALVAALVAAVFGIRAYVNTEDGRHRWDRYKLRLPLVGSILERAVLARFARSFAMSLRAGVPLIQGLSVTARAVGNAYVSERLLTMRNGIERGESLTRTAGASGLFTPLVMQMLAVGEETGAVDDLLREVGEFYEREVDYDLKALSSAIEPILTVAIGIIVLILALGVFLPMWDLVGIARG